MTRTRRVNAKSAKGKVDVGTVVHTPQLWCLALRNDSSRPADCKAVRGFLQVWWRGKAGCKMLVILRKLVLLSLECWRIRKWGVVCLQGMGWRQTKRTFY
jgi:hypothetical protein